MKAASANAGSKAVIWERAVHFERELSPASAKALLQVRFAPSEHRRMNTLLEKSRTRKLAPKEEQALDTYELLGSLLGILHSKARQVLKKRAGRA
jgi:hypothetical protein